MPASATGAAIGLGGGILMSLYAASNGGFWFDTLVIFGLSFAILGAIIGLGFQLNDRER